MHVTQFMNSPFDGHLGPYIVSLLQMYLLYKHSYIYFLKHMYEGFSSVDAYK